MGKKAKKQLEKQVKLLRKSLKAELKQLERSDTDSPLMNLSKKQISQLAIDMLSGLTASNDQAEKVVHQITPKPSEMSYALKPAKKSPCKQCPALAGGLCKCAIKQQKKHAATTLKVNIL